jgi:hypothetical protein
VIRQQSPSPQWPWSNGKDKEPTVCQGVVADVVARRVGVDEE